MIKLRMPITEENKQLGFSKEDQSNLQMLAEKLLEEASEVMISVSDEENNDLFNTICEVIDVLQVATLMLAAIDNKDPKIIQQAELKHIEKLFDRGWKHRKMVVIQED